MIEVAAPMVFPRHVPRATRAQKIIFNCNNDGESAGERRKKLMRALRGFFWTL